MKTQIRLKSYKTIGNFTQRPNEISCLLATINRHKYAPPPEMGLRLFVGSSVPSDGPSLRLSACIRESPYTRIYVKQYNVNFYANLSRNYKLRLCLIVVGDIKLPLKRSLLLKWYQSFGTVEEQLKSYCLSGRGLLQVGS